MLMNIQKWLMEFRTSMIFGILFILFAMITGFVTKNYGAGGIKVLSFAVGVTEIDPFIINLFQSMRNIENATPVTAVIFAITGNNLLKMIYGIAMSDKHVRRKLIYGFGILIILGLVFAFIFPL